MLMSSHLACKIWDGCTSYEEVCTLFATLQEGHKRTGSASELVLLCSVLAECLICENAKTLKRIVARPQHFNRPLRRSLTLILLWDQQDHIRSGVALPVG